MERPRWPVASYAAKVPHKKWRLSPLPSAAESRAGGSQLCRRRLFGRGSEPAGQGLKRKLNVRTLPKIKESLEVAGMNLSCNQSNQMNIEEAAGVENTEEKTDDSITLLKFAQEETLESKQHLKDDVTSSTGMTLPTGVSTLLIECLDVDTMVDCDASAGSSLSSVPSPETFRDDDSEQSHFYPEDFGKYKNSTLLDSSKALAIDKLPQISNLSAIVGPVMKDFQDQCTRRKKSAAGNYNSSALSVSTTLAGGKKVCKITAVTERTPTLKAGMRCPSPLEAERKPDNQTSKPKKPKSSTKENPDLSKQNPASPKRLKSRRKGNSDSSDEGLLSPKRPKSRRKENPDPSQEDLSSLKSRKPKSKENPDSSDKGPLSRRRAKSKRKEHPDPSEEGPSTPKRLMHKRKENLDPSEEGPSSPKRLMPRRKENVDPSEEGPSSPKRLMPRRKENVDSSEEGPSSPKRLMHRRKENPDPSEEGPSLLKSQKPKRKENHDPSEEASLSPKRLKPRRKETPDPSEESPSSLGQLDAPGNTSVGLAVPPCRGTGAGRPLPDGLEICTIIRTSPTKKPPRFPRFPPKSFRLPEGAIEDDITNMKNWTFCKRR